MKTISSQTFVPEDTFTFKNVHLDGVQLLVSTELTPWIQFDDDNKLCEGVRIGLTFESSSTKAVAVEFDGCLDLERLPACNVESTVLFSAPRENLSWRQIMQTIAEAIVAKEGTVSLIRSSGEKVEVEIVLELPNQELSVIVPVEQIYQHLRHRVTERAS